MTGAAARWLALGAVLAGGTLAATTGASAQDTAKQCRDKAVSTYDIVQCQKAELAVVEAELNTLYQATLATLPVDQRAKLVAAERLWIAFRQSDCDVFYGKETGTIASVQGGDCMIGHARARIADLKVLTTP